jgi:hypothetical protein
LCLSYAYLNITAYFVDVTNRDREEICVVMDDQESYVMFVDEAELAVRSNWCIITSL